MVIAMDMTIDELARRVEMTARNIREWQTNGLIPPPQRRGRIGIYNDAHISHIERIKSLRSQGFPLDVIRRILEQSGDSAPEVRRLASEVLSPANLTGSMEMKRADLAEQFGADAERNLADCGLIDLVDDELLIITDTRTFDYVEKLAAIGLPLDKIARALTHMADHQIASMQALVDLYRDEIWEPFLHAGLPIDDWPAIADKTIQLRSLGIGLGMQAFRRAIDNVAGRIATEEATKMDVPRSARKRRSAP
ncbi:MerR family transcriptional regulator [Mycobacterium terramassiliense]|uniref:MerR family transcriptional regulator n=1 Tax=Mycobacterium terramassiliense TaxID=1841859 RepID=A0A2U3NDQ0_9MYCO|nr:MerR family transcriptional regulator [Mycobacterium terramassiliense]